MNIEVGMSGYKLHTIPRSAECARSACRHQISAYAKDRDTLARANQIGRLPEKMQNAIGIIPIYISNRFGIPVSSILAPVILFIENVQEINTQMNVPLSLDVRGVGSFTDGPVVIVDTTEDFAIDIVTRAFHETLHTTGEQHFASIYQHKKDKFLLRYVRQGFEILSSPNGNRGAWVLEEGLIAYMQSEFREYLGEVYDLGYQDRRNLISKRKEDLHGRLSVGRPSVSFSDSVTLEPKYIDIRFTDADKNNYDLYVYPRTAFAGTAFEALIQPLSPSEREKFIQEVQSARQNVEKICSLAHKIDSMWGRGTYSKILRLPNNKDEFYIEVWELVKDLRSRIGIG